TSRQMNLMVRITQTMHRVRKERKWRAERTGAAYNSNQLDSVCPLVRPKKGCAYFRRDAAFFAAVFAVVFAGALAACLLAALVDVAAGPLLVGLFAALVPAFALVGILAAAFVTAFVAALLLAATAICRVARVAEGLVAEIFDAPAFAAAAVL